MSYFTGPVTPPSPSNQETIRGNPYISSADKTHRRSVDKFATTQSQDYVNFADRFAPNGEAYSNHQMMNQNTGTPFSIGIVDTDTDAVEELHRQSATLDMKGSMVSDMNNGFGTMTGHHHPAYLQLPKELNPLPQTLADNHQNAMYFQHFLSETAPLLVPHDCAGNPFKSVLPQSRYPVSSSHSSQ